MITVDKYGSSFAGNQQLNARQQRYAMNSNRSEAIVNSLSALHDLEVSVRGTRIDDAQILMEKMYLSMLSSLHS